MACQGELFPALLVVQGGATVYVPLDYQKLLASRAYLSPVLEGTHIETILPPVKNDFFTNVPLSVFANVP